MDEKNFDDTKQIMGINVNSKTPIKMDAFTGNIVLSRTQHEHIFTCRTCGRNFGGSAHLYMKHLKEEHDINCSTMPIEGKEYSQP